MSDTSVKDETAQTGDTQTEATTTSVQVTDNASAAEVERLRKEAEQKELRIRQLENEAAAKKKAEEDATAKELEKNEEYKTLLEQEREKRLELERKEEAREAKAELTKAKQSVLKDFPEEVQTQAEDLGIDLSDANEEAVEAYKVKLTKLNDNFASNGKVTSNNGRQTNPKYDEHEILQAHAKGDGNAINEALNHIPWIADNIKQG